MRSLCGSIDVVSLHAATMSEIDAVATAHGRPRYNPRTSALCIRVTFKRVAGGIGFDDAPGIGAPSSMM